MDRYAIDRKHCDHCDPTCKKWDADRRAGDWPGDRDHFNSDGVEWDIGECPACAERARIVVLLESDDVMGVDDALYYILHDQHMEDE